MDSLKNDIERYRNGTLSAQERHALEKRALNDPFLEDALEGVQSVSEVDLSSDLRDLEKKFGQQGQTWFTPLRIAASVLLLAAGGAAFFLADFGEQPQLAAQKESLPVAKDSLNPRTEDSTKNLLTLAKPEEDKPKSTATTRSKGDLAPAVTKSEPVTELPSPVSGASADAKSAEEKVVEAESKLADPIAEDKEKLAQNIQVAPAVSLADRDAQEIVKRQEDVKKDASAKRRLAAPKFSDDARASGSAKAARTITGHVVAQEDGVPLPGVNVIVKGTTNGTVTDANGNFTIETDDDKAQLVLSFIGLETIDTKVGADNVVSVKMKEDAAQLSEVVVTAYGIQEQNDNREPVIRSATPVGGIRAYNKYLENNVRYPAEALEKNIKGKVTVQFTVEAGGALSDFNVLKSLGYGCDEEVIRLVKEGPKWTPTSQDDVAVDTQVKVRVKFDPAKAKK